MSRFTVSRLICVSGLKRCWLSAHAVGQHVVLRLVGVLELVGGLRESDTGKRRAQQRRVSDSYSSRPSKVDARNRSGLHKAKPRHLGGTHESYRLRGAAVRGATGIRSRAKTADELKNADKTQAQRADLRHELQPAALQPAHAINRETVKRLMPAWSYSNEQQHGRGVAAAGLQRVIYVTSHTRPWRSTP